MQGIVDSPLTGLWRSRILTSRGADMQVDLLAGTEYRPLAVPRRQPTILVFDSGLGGLTVLSRTTRPVPARISSTPPTMPVFPMAGSARTSSSTRVLAVMERLIARYHPDLVVIACNTASTLRAAGTAGALRHPLRRHGAGDQAAAAATRQRYDLGPRARPALSHASIRAS